MCYVNSNGLLFPESIEIIVDIFENNRDIDVIIGYCTVIDKIGIK